MIVGFPGETPALFGETVDLLERMPLSYLHVFTFSERENTAAALMRNPVEPRERYHRSDALRALGRRKREAFHVSFLGESLGVLLEQASGGGATSGLTTNYIRVEVPEAGGLINQIVPVTITGASDEGCTGTLVTRVPATVA